MSSLPLLQRLPRHLKLNELRVFAAVFEHRSFRKAAAELHLTQPAVTKGIAGLEEMLGVKLFDRFSHGVEPTVHGLSFAPRAVAVFDELRRAAQDLDRVSSGVDASLRVGISAMPAIPFLPLAIKRLAEIYPRVFIVVIEDRQPELLDRLRKRDIEVAILRMSLLDLAEDLQATRLFDEKLCVVAAKTHPLAACNDVTWPELLAERWVLAPQECYFYEHVRKTLFRKGLQMPSHTVEALAVQLQFNMVLHGGMLGFGMRSQIEFAPGKGLVVRVPFELDSPERPVAAVMLKTHAPSPLAQHLISHMRGLNSPS